MKALPKLAEWLVFLFFLFAQLSFVGSLYFCSLIVAKWLNQHRPGAILPDDSIWCFKDGFAPYIEIACLIIAASVIGKIFEKQVPLVHVLVPVGILLIFFSIYIAGLGSVTVNWGGLIDYFNWK